MKHSKLFIPFAFIAVLLSSCAYGKTTTANTNTATTSKVKILENNLYELNSSIKSLRTQAITNEYDIMEANNKILELESKIKKLERANEENDFSNLLCTPNPAGQGFTCSKINFNIRH